MITLTRRHVIATLTASSAVALCPAAVMAVEWNGGATPASDSETVGYKELIQLAEGENQVDITDLQPGEVAVVSRPSADALYLNTGAAQNIAVHRRTADQIAAADAVGRAGDTPEYYVANLVCPHRGFAISITNDPMKPFACNKQGGRHGSVFDASGFGIEGASKDEALTVPGHSLTVSEGTVVLTLA